MQKTTSPLLGMQIITSEGEIFNHVDDNLPMWSEDGERQVSTEIEFAAPFQKPPHIHLGLSGIDSSQAQNLRFNLLAEDITVEGFRLVFRTWSDTRIGRASVNWTAIGAGVPLPDIGDVADGSLFSE